MLRSTCIIAIAALTPLIAQAEDNGCYALQDECVSMRSEWRGDNFVSKFTNNCPGRIYIKFCNGRKGRSPDCGESGLPSGRTKTWETTNGSADGRYGAIYIGSRKSSADWVCSQRANGWSEWADDF